MKYLPITNILRTTLSKTMIIMAFPNHAINAPDAANTVIALTWSFLLVSLLLKTTKNYFLHQVLLVITREYTLHNVNYVTKFTFDKLKTNFQLDGLIAIRFGKLITYKTTLIKLLLYFISIITTRISSVPSQTFQESTTSYFCINLDITIILISAKANRSIN